MLEGSAGSPRALERRGFGERRGACIARTSVWKRFWLLTRARACSTLPRKTKAGLAKAKINPRVTLAAGLARVFGYAAQMEFRAAARAHGALRIGFRLAFRPSAIGLVLGALAACGAQ